MDEMVPVEAGTVTINGSQFRPNSAAWTGLDFRHAELRERSIWSALVGPEATDHHLMVKWEHPQDRASGLDSGTAYRVRPRMEPGKKWQRRKVTTARFERKRGGKWFIRVTYAA